MFPKKQRITKKSDFDLIYKKGSTCYSSFLMAKHLKNDYNFQRFAVIVSTKISNKATVRNLLKRRLRELLKEFKSNLPTKSDIVIYTKKGVQDLSFQELKKEFQKLWEKNK